MRRYLLFLILIVVGNTQGLAQKIKTDIFDNLIYESKNRDYKASFKENIFNDLIFSDNNGNEVTFKNKYIEFEYEKLLQDKKAKLDLFISMIHAHSQDRNYIATYSVDIFDTIIIEDNRNRKVEIGKDIFGNIIYNEESSGVERFVKRNSN